MSNDMSLRARPGETPEDVLERVTQAARRGLGIDAGPRIPFSYYLSDNFEGDERFEHLSDETGIAQEILRDHRATLGFPSEAKVSCILDTKTWTIEIVGVTTS